MMQGAEYIRTAEARYGMEASMSETVIEASTDFVSHVMCENHRILPYVELLFSG